ncbi:MAG: hypothetical protein ACTSWY_13945 [Promethearchaeota archaeon]
MFKSFEENFEEKFHNDYKITIGVNILTKVVVLTNGTRVSISIWDIGEQERFRYIKQIFFKGGSGIILIFDLSRKSSWNAVKIWYTNVIKTTGIIPFVLIGYKLELVKDVGESINCDECLKWAENNGGFYFEIKSGDISTVDKAIIKLTEIIVKKFLKNR